MATILVIEDLLDNARLISKALGSRGHEVIWAETGELGLEMAEEHKPDLILLDLGLPDIDGQVLIGWLRDIPEVKDTPIIVVTAWPEQTARKMAEQYNFDGYIGKPFAVREFIETIESFLQ